MKDPPLFGNFLITLGVENSFSYIKFLRRGAVVPFETKERIVLSGGAPAAEIQKFHSLIDQAQAQFEKSQIPGSEFRKFGQARTQMIKRALTVRQRHGSGHHPFLAEHPK